MDKYTKWMALISNQLLAVEKLLNQIACSEVKDVYDNYNNLIDFQIERYSELVKEEKEQCKNLTSTG